MELWIRSQDKECLMKVDRLDYDLSNNEHRIMVNGYKTLVAKYETKERALEVLDEIQKKLVLEKYQHITSRFGDYTGLTNYNISYKDIYVYEMPKE